MKLIMKLSAVLLLVMAACTNQPSSTQEQELEALLTQMTLDEKIGQLHQLNGFWDVTGPVPESGDSKVKYDQLKNGHVGSVLNVRGVEQVRKLQKIAIEETRLGIPLLFGFDLIHGYDVVIPEPMAEAASWDMDLIERAAAMTAKEATAAGINWAFGPMIDISRDARWGRIMEGAGEDPYLVSKIAQARVRGFQGDELDSPHSLAACPKHFAAYGFAESGKDYNTADISDITLHNIVLPPFKAAIDAGARTMMTSFNIIQGIPATANDYLVRQLLKDRWGFDGLVVSDWGSFAEMITHGYAPDAEFATQQAMLAGTDMDMESQFYNKHLKTLVENGSIPMKYIDDAVRRVLRVKYDLGLFEDPYLYCDLDREKEFIGSDKHLEVAYESAVKSIVLLKNEQDILPLKKSQRVAYIGPMVDDKNISLGNWRLAAEDNSAVSIVEALDSRSIPYEFTQGVRLVEQQVSFPFEVQLNTTDDSGIDKAVALAKKAEIVVLAVGEDGFQTGEGRSRASLKLPGLQRELIKAVAAVNQNIVLINHSGRPLDLSWEAAHSMAVVQAWHLGTESGNAIVDVLYGQYNPSGKLPMTFPRSVGQVPIYYNHLNTGRPSNPGSDLVFWSHYTDESIDPLFAFGHGLNYSSIEINSVDLSSTSMTKEGSIKVSVELKNNSDIAGQEVLQLYIRDHFASFARPVKELKDFKLVPMAAQEQKTVEFEIDAADLQYYDRDGQVLLEEGSFSLMIGFSSDQLREREFKLNTKL